MGNTEKAWMVRAGRDAILAEQFEEKKLVAIGFDLGTDISKIKGRDELKQMLRDKHPHAPPLAIALHAGQLWRISREIKPGDYLLTYLPLGREYLIGRVSGDYQFDPQAISQDDDSYPQVRRVESWEKIERSQLSQAARNTLGATMALFEVTKLLPELKEALAGRTVEEVPDFDETDEVVPLYDYETVKGQSEELIGDMLAKLDGYEFEELVAALLRAMGYHVTQSAKGPDRGVDILAGPDPFHLEQPRIKVQVKKRESATSSDTIRSFIGILQNEDRGLFVSFSGYTKDAKLEAERSNRPLSLLDRLTFTNLLLEHYEKLEPEYQRWLPLKSVYLPTTTE